LKLLFWSKAALAAAALAVAGSLAGCASMADKKALTGELSGALLVVRLADRLESPAALTVEVALLREGGATSFTARRQQSVPGRYADYLLALALPPQRYVLTGIRDADTAAAEPASLQVSVTVPFEVKPGAPMYLGRLVLAPASAGGPAIEAQDHYDEDTLLFRSAVAALRGATIDRNVIANGVLSSATTSAATPSAPRPGAPTARQLTAEVIGPDADAQFTRAARDAFAKFLRLQAPRAFAIGNADARFYAYSMGTGAVERAMRDCARQAPGRSCRLFAVDDTILSP
jgi:hypothetical protein